MFKRPKIFVKILAVVAAAIVLSVGMCSAAIYLYLEPIIRQSIINSSDEMVEKMLQQVSYSLEAISDYATNVAFDDTVQESLTATEDGVYRQYSGIQRLERKLKEYVMLRGNLIYAIYVIDPTYTTLEMNNTYGYFVEQYPRYREFLNQGHNGYSPVHTVKYGSTGSAWETIAFTNDIFSKVPPYPYIGKLVVLLNLSELLEPVRFDEASGIAIELRHQQSGLIYSSDPARNLERELEGEGGAKTNHLFCRELSAEGWYAVYAISGEQVSASFRQINTIIIGIVFVCMLVMLLAVGRIVTSIVKPLETLIRGMQQVSGGSRSEQIVVHTGDEIEEAALVFNQMVEDISRHTQELLDSEKKEHEAELRMLLYQINPHFIYNTLNCIICLARRDDSTSIVSLTKIFINLLRTILRVDLKTMTTLREEIVYMDRYVGVLQYSYNNVPDLKWEVDEGLLDIRLPKLILYPLVENSIFYGVIPAERESGVTIRVCRQEDGGVHVSVEDTGRGVEEQLLETLRRRMDTLEDSGGHIGLANVNNRLILIYGPGAGLHIDSRFQEGTTVSFTFHPS